MGGLDFSFSLTSFHGIRQRTNKVNMVVGNLCRLFDVLSLKK